MNVFNELENLFHVSLSECTERIKIVEAKCKVNSASLPLYKDISGFITKIPSRDIIRMTLSDDSDDQIYFTTGKMGSELQYKEFCKNALFGDMVEVSVTVNKSYANNRFSIYDFGKFADDILSLSIGETLAAFSLLLQSNEYIFFELLNGEQSFMTKTMHFSPSNENINITGLCRKERIDNCKETSYFYNLSSYPLLPDDFKIQIDYDGNPLSELFKELTTLLSLIYVASSCSIENGIIKGQITGQRNVDFHYDLVHVRQNDELYKIYSWIYTDGSPIDKAIIARNVISLHCKYSEIIDIDGKTLASIQSNFNLYLKSNVTQYLELKNKLAEFICNVVTKTGDYTTYLLDKFKANLVAIFAFLFTVILANIVSKRPLSNIFTYDISVILEWVLFGSAVYLIICNLESRYQLRKIRDGYEALKRNYSTLLSSADIDEAFEKDSLMENMNKTVIHGLIGYTVLWAATIIGAIITIESMSSTPPISTLIMHIIKLFHK